MFSVLGGREIAERISVILQGESGANDPVGIAVVLGLIEVDRHQAGIGAMVLHVTLGLAIGAAVGVGGGLLMRRVMARPTLATDSLYPLRSLAGAGIIYGLASVLEGSGFLAVFIAGMLVAEAEATRGKDIELVHQVLASLGEIVVFVALGLTIHIESLGFRSVWVDGLVISVMLVLIARPLVVGLLLTPLRYPRREQAFIAWAGLRGAVPILLAAFTLIENLPGAHRIYGLVFVVVLVTVLVQGTLLPWVAERCSVTGEPAPSGLGRAGDLADRVDLEHVAFLEVVVPVDGEAALEALGDLAGVVLEPLQRVDPAVVDDGAVADEADLGAALDDALGDHAAGDRAQPGDLEDLPHLGLAEDLLDLLGHQHADQRLLDVVGHLVDDVVGADVDALALRLELGLGVGPDVEADHDRVRRGGQADVATR